MKSHLIFLAIFIHQLLNPKVSAQVGDNLEHEILSKHLLPEGDVLSLSYYEELSECGGHHSQESECLDREGLYTCCQPHQASLP